MNLSRLLFGGNPEIVQSRAKSEKPVELEACTVFTSLLPGGVVVAELYTASASAADLLPDEAEVLTGRRVVEKRRLEFAAGRKAAHLALARLGLRPTAILTGSGREPLWPAGVVGSITHCSGYCAAAAAYRQQVTTLGIDAEPHAPLPPDVLEMVCTEAEQSLVHALPQAEGIHWATVIFSAKESVYKAWYPLAHRWLGFEEVVVTLAPHEHSFMARRTAAPREGFGIESIEPEVFVGRFGVREGRVYTAAWCPQLS